MRFRDTYKLFMMLIISFFIISTILTALGGFDLKTSAFWSLVNILGAAFPPNPSLVDAPNFYVLLSEVFGILGEFLVTVLLTTIFYQFMSNVNLGAKIANYKRKRLSRHIIITPINSFSIELARTLKRNQIPFIMLDARKNAVERANEERLLSVYGDPTQISSLAFAKILNASYLILLGDDDIKNILIAITAKKLNKKIRVAARIRREEDIPRMYMAGVNKVILPEIAIGDEISDFLIKQKKV